MDKIRKKRTGIFLDVLVKFEIQIISKMVQVYCFNFLEEAMQNLIFLQIFKAVLRTQISQDTKAFQLNW